MQIDYFSTHDPLAIYSAISVGFGLSLGDGKFRANLQSLQENVKSLSTQLEIWCVSIKLTIKIELKRSKSKQLRRIFHCQTSF